MQVMKFGGASISDAKGVRNVSNIVQNYINCGCIIVVSAMGKTTNALESVVKTYFKDKNESLVLLENVFQKHLLIMKELFAPEHAAFDRVRASVDKIIRFVEDNKSPNYDFVYDQIVSLGELISSTILYEFIKISIPSVEWLDARELIKTDTNYRDANVDWNITQQLINSRVTESKMYLTQGFIGSDFNGFTTTLGREGSDYSASIFAYSTDSESVSVWKDVLGVYNADPRYFADAILLEKISYKEAIELTFYGASVIHPKTLQPLQQKEIPLYVKSFVEPQNKGTVICQTEGILPKVPCYIVKKEQHLISFSSKDFSFITESNIGIIFSALDKYKIKVFLMQNSAITFSVCVEDKFDNLSKLIEELSYKLNIKYNNNVSLYTIRHFSEEDALKILADKKIILRQRSRETLQVVTI